MKILSVSDRVENKLLNKAENCLPAKPDLILACGDLPPEYLTDLREIYAVPLYFIEGNHDLRYHKSPPVGCTNLHAKLITEQGLRIMGFSGSRWYNGGVNQYTESEMKKMVRSLWFQLLQHRKVDIIITHAPPRFIQDQEDPCHKGFKSFIPLIEKQKPAWFIHGHIHALFNDPAERISKVCDTKVINSYGFFFFETELVEKQTKSR
ncbi:MAG: metallophosphoesterase [Thermodesulfobacteriota bacterium]|nr:metallophosphoesterase [Thermodesulfobacteriota bacterium]